MHDTNFNVRINQVIEKSDMLYPMHFSISFIEKYHEDVFCIYKRAHIAASLGGNMAQHTSHNRYNINITKHKPEWDHLHAGNTRPLFNLY